jgi:nucleotidyltransferase substrate binding protein (TIGR01987 family)
VILKLEPALLLALIVTSPLTAALAQLKKNAALPQSAIGRDHPELVEAFRAATIQSFAYTYELAMRMMRRGLESRASTPAEIDQMPFKTLVRTAAEKGFVDDPAAWVLFRDKRHITSHANDEAEALDVLAVIPQFIEKVAFLLDRLTMLNNPSQ